MAVWIATLLKVDYWLGDLLFTWLVTESVGKWLRQLQQDKWSSAMLAAVATSNTKRIKRLKGEGGYMGFVYQGVTMEDIAKCDGPGIDRAYP
jgi:hypothetical protein